MQRATIQLDNARGHRIQEAAIVGNDNDAAAGIEQQGFQPGDSIEVQMVGGFVQQQQIRLVRQRTRQRHTFAHAAGEACGFFVGIQAQLLDQGLGTRGPLPVFTFR